MKPFLPLVILFLGVLHATTAIGSEASLSFRARCYDLVSGKSFAQKVEALLTPEYASGLIEELTPQFADLARTTHSKDLPNVLLKSYINLRSKSLPPEVAQLVRDWMFHGKIEVVTRPSIGGHYDYIRNKIKLIFPQELATSLVYSYVLVHELEHIIQTRIVGIGSASYINPLHFPVHRFSLEKGAMRAEAAFLLSLPDDQIQNTLQIIESVFARNKIKNAKFIKFAFENALHSQSTEDYIQTTWDQGRYSYSDLLRLQIQNLALFPGSVPLIIAVTQYMGW